MTSRQVELLDAAPSLSRLYVSAAATAARSHLPGGTGSLALPECAHEVRGVTADPGRLTEFQHLLGQTARDTVPSGYLHILAFPVTMSVMARPDFPLPLLGMVHLSNRVEHLAPVLYTERLTMTAWAEDLRGHRAGTQVDLIAEIRSELGNQVLWRGRSTYLAKGVYLPGVDSQSATGGRPDFRAPDPTALWRLGVDTGRAYAAVSGDFNPIHLSVLTAKALGMRRSIAHGMYLAARVLAEAASPEPDRFSWNISFEAPVFLPALVAVNISSEADDGAVGFAGWNARTGRRHFTGSVGAL